MTDNCDIPDAPADATAVEKADVAVAQAVAPIARTPLVEALGTLSEVGDQPQMRVLCAGLVAAGLWRRDARMTRAGIAMLAAHSVATGMKNFVKNRVDRTRPTKLVDEGVYDMGEGDSHEHDETSFPSGHTAGAVSAAAAFAHVYPEYRVPAFAAAGAVSLMQIPRCAHYPSDVGAGALVGIVAGAAVNAAFDAIAGTGADRPAEDGEV